MNLTSQQGARNLGLLLLLALLIRLATFNGAFGSDDLTYFQRALALARGDWTSADYNGALRYGFNLPAAGFMALFGESVFAANLWPLTCSLIEIGAVYVFATASMSPRAGLFAALLLACAPLHIAVATRMHADPVVSMFITVGFVLLYFGALRRQPMLLMAAGLSIGGIFWAKELAAVTWFAFLPMLCLFRGQWRNCLYVIAAITLMMGLHGVLMWLIAGDPLHLVKIVSSAVKRNFVDAGQGEDGAAYYLHYLFIDLRHTGLLGFFAILSIWFLPRLVKEKDPLQTGLIFAMVWWIGLLAVLSLFPVSLSPLRLTMKQSNYITLFLAPTALVAGMVLAMLERNFGRLLLAVSLVCGLLLGALQQADYRAFTANSKALATFSAQHSGALIIGSTNNSRLGTFWANQMYPDSPKAPIYSFLEISKQEGAAQLPQGEAFDLFAVIDPQTINWVAGKNSVTSARPCWQHVQMLEPTGLGLGNELAKLTGETLNPPFASLDRLAHPQRADVYSVKGADVLCRKHTTVTAYK